MKKKLQKDWKDDLGGMVYSTNKQFDFSIIEDTPKTLSPNEQQLICKYENKGRGGKTVCIVSGFIGTDENLNDLAKTLKNKCGVGGTAKAGEIIIQGNVRDKVMQILQEMGYKTKRVGG